MTNQPPSRNLPPDAEMWGRWVDQQLTFNAAETSRTLQTIGNSLSALNGTLEKLSTQVEGLATQQAISSIARTFYYPVADGGVSSTGTTQQVQLSSPVTVVIPPKAYALVTISGWLQLGVNSSGSLLGQLGTSFISLNATAQSITPGLMASTAFLQGGIPANGAGVDISASVSKTVRLSNMTLGSLSPSSTNLSLYVGGYGPVGRTTGSSVTGASMLVQILYQEPDAPSVLTP